MCGIVATFGGADIVSRAVKQYDKQQHRGSEGYGYLALRKQRIIGFERTSTEKGILEHLKTLAEYPEAMQLDALLFHHRYPTSTINVPESAHPLPVTMKGWKNNYYILHNGVIPTSEHEQEISKAGYRFKSRVSEVKMYRAGGKLYEQVTDSEINDSEILGYYVAELLEGKRKDIPVYGAIAAIVLQENKKTKLCTVYAMRNTMNPLKVFRVHEGNKHTLDLASEGKGAELPTGKIHVLDWKTLVFHSFLDVSIGKTWEQSLPSRTGYNSGRHSKNWDDEDYSNWFKTRPNGNGTVLPLPGTGTSKGTTPLLDVPARGSGDESVIMSELARLKSESDKAYADYEEALILFSDDLSDEGLKWISDLKDEADKKEEEYQELLESLGDAELEKIADVTAVEENETSRMPF